MTESIPVYGDAPVSAIRKLEVELTEDEALALAQFVKRIGWSEYRDYAVDDVEASNMKAAVIQLQDALGRAGYAPQ